MKRQSFTVLFLLSAITLFAQKADDNLIIVTVSDTSKLYERVRQAITFSDLIIREDSKRDTLITYSERIYDKSIFVVARVVISGNNVEITGAYGLGYENFWGLPAWPRSYKRVIYYKGSEAWLILRRIAIKLDAKIQYLRID
jgi:hypothetical protein